MNPVIDLLRRTRKRIESPDHWRQGFFAANKKGEPCLAKSPDACSWCIVGALIVECPDDILLRLTALGAMDRKAGVIGGAVGFNDAHTHAEVLALIDRTIEALEKQE